MEDLRSLQKLQMVYFLLRDKSLGVISSLRRMIVAILKLVIPYPLC